MGLSRAKSSILTQLRTGAIGLNNFLAAWNIPNITPEYKCGWIHQTPKYIIVYYPYLGGREQIQTKAETLNYNKALWIKQGAEAITI